LLSLITHRRATEISFFRVAFRQPFFVNVVPSPPNEMTFDMFNPSIAMPVRIAGFSATLCTTLGLSRTNLARKCSALISARIGLRLVLSI
jgi:hypothetical protein